MDLERNDRITIKLNAIELNHTAKDGETYIFHDWHAGAVDFTYEVSLAACEGAYFGGRCRSRYWPPTFI